MTDLNKLLHNLDTKLAGKTVGHSIAITKGPTSSFSRVPGRRSFRHYRHDLAHPHGRAQHEQDHHGGRRRASTARKRADHRREHRAPPSFLVEARHQHRQGDLPSRSHPHHGFSGSQRRRHLRRAEKPHRGRRFPRLSRFSFLLEQQLCSLPHLALPYLWKGATALDPIAGNASLAPIMLGVFYASYIWENVLRPCGVNDATVGYTPPVTDASPPAQAEWYDFPDTSKISHHGSETDAILRVGADYWNMSARQYGKFIAHLRHGFVASTNVWKTMRDTRILGAPPPPPYPTGDARLGYLEISR